MPSELNPPPRSILRNPFLYSSLVLAVVMFCVGWVLLSRWQENRDFERRAAAEKRAAEHERARRTIEVLGGDRFEILSFYAIPASLRRGETAQLCYGVSNAASVRIEPAPSGGVWPSLSRCVEIAPKKDTTYTLTAEDASGHTQTAKLLLQVR